MTDPHVLHVDEHDFDAIVLRSPRPVLVDFWATWCGPCRAIAPSVSAVARGVAGRADVAKVDVDQSPELASRYKVRSIPTLVVFHAGKEVERIMGAVPRGDIEALLQRHLGT